MWCTLATPQVETELKTICKDILEVLDKHLIPSANTGESKVFYYKMYVLTECQHARQPRPCGPARTLCDALPPLTIPFGFEIGWQLSAHQASLSGKFPFRCGTKSNRYAARCAPTTEGGGHGGIAPSLYNNGAQFACISENKMALISGGWGGGGWVEAGRPLSIQVVQMFGCH